MKTAIVTGANGFIGSALVRELVRRNVTVYAVVKDINSDVREISNLPHVQIIYCDMDNLKRLAYTICKPTQEIYAFYHLAWSGSTGMARGDYACQLKNTIWTADAVHAASTLGCKRFVGIGTLAEYDVGAYVSLDHSTPNIVSTYGTAKIAAHYISKAECNSLGIEHLWAYLSNVYGPGNYTSNFINFAAKTMLSGMPANFTAGEQNYDFTYISDIAQGLFCVGEDGHRNCSYYIGSGKPAKLKEFIKILRDKIDPSIMLHLGAIPFNGISQPESTFDCSKLMHDTNYRPQVAFADGIKVTIEWIISQLRNGKL